MKFTTLIPMRFNDGREVPQEQINRIIDELAIQFSGCSDEGITKGQWLDPKDAQLYRDESRRVTVVCDARQLFVITMACSSLKSLPHEDQVMNTTAQKALHIAQELATQAKSAADLHNAFFGVGGKFGELFPTRAEREAFAKTPEYQEIVRLRAALAAGEEIAS
jgi:hypothetical protein